jgi:hypothetical protein
MVLLLYVTVDYGDARLPGVFSFGLESFFVESLRSESQDPAVVAPAAAGSPGARPSVERTASRSALAIRLSVVPLHYSPPRVHGVAAQPSSPDGASDDH